MYSIYIIFLYIAFVCFAACFGMCFCVLLIYGFCLYYNIFFVICIYRKRVQPVGADCTLVGFLYVCYVYSVESFEISTHWMVRGFGTMCCVGGSCHIIWRDDNIGPGFLLDDIES